MSDMTITVPPEFDERMAHAACHAVFGEDISGGPVLPRAPGPLLEVLADWPKGKTDQAIEVALHLPMRFDISHEMMKDGVKAVVLTVNRVTILHRGRQAGWALRTNAAGLDAIALWADTWTRHRLRLAH